MCYMNKVLLLLFSKWTHTAEGQLGTQLSEFAWTGETWVLTLDCESLSWCYECMFLMVRCDLCQREDMQASMRETR